MARYEARSFTEPAEYAAAIHGAEIDLTVTGAGHFLAEVVCINLNFLRVQQFSESLPRVMHIASDEPRAPFVFQTGTGPGIIRDGIEISSTRLARAPSRRSYFQRSVRPVRWGSVSLAVDTLNSPVKAADEVDLSPPLREQVIDCPPDAITTLRRLHASAVSFAGTAPEMLENPEVTRGMEQVLTQALIECLAGNDVQRPTLGRHRHRVVMERFFNVLEADTDRAIYVVEMARAVGASLRSLTQYCQEYIGISFKKYLLLRRLHLARCALLEANAHTKTVTDVAVEFGFWQFGRFAVQYKAQFGEAPSVTLRRSASPKQMDLDIRKHLPGFP